MPSLSESSNLIHHRTVIIQKIINLVQELGVPPDPNVLSHLEAGDLGVLGASRDFTVIVAENASLVRRNLIISHNVVSTNPRLQKLGTYAVLSNAIGTELGLVLTESDASGIATIVLGSVSDESSPSASNIEHPEKYQSPCHKCR